jgi:hypothetical protein
MFVLIITGGLCIHRTKGQQVGEMHRELSHQLSYPSLGSVTQL